MTIDAPSRAAAGPSTTAVPVLAGLAAVADRYRVLLCDVWGVVHNGVRAHEAACQALMRFRAKGGVVVMVSNAPRPAAPVLAQMVALGVPEAIQDAVVTSGDVTRAAVLSLPEPRIYAIGAPKDEPFYEGLSAPRVALGEATVCVCTGLRNDASETLDDYEAELQAVRARGLPFICANPDIVVELGARLLFCAGALAARYAAMGGEVRHAGKPHPPIYTAALGMAERLMGRTIALGEVLAIGDSLATDVAGARGLGVDALFLAEGIHASDLRGADGRADWSRLPELMKARGERPTWVMERLAW